MWWPGIEHHRVGERPPRGPPRVNENVGIDVFGVSRIRGSK